MKRGLLFFCLSASVHAHDLTTLPQVEAIGERPDRTALGRDAEQLPAGTVILDSDDIAAMNIGHVMDLFRTSTGLVVRNINQGDVGDDFGLRGFAGGHGVDAAVYVDGVPINQVNGRTHGLADLNWLLPQMIERVEITKGPFSARSGNFALGGTVNIVTKGSLNGGAIDATLGRFGYGQAVASYGNGAPFVIAEGFTSDGFRDNAFSERAGLFAKHSFGDEHRFSVVAQIDTRRFGAPGYLPVADVVAGRRARTAAINTSDGGDVDHAQAYLTYASTFEDHLDVAARLYAIRDERSRYADFGAGQSVTFTEGNTFGFGADIEHRWSTILFAGGIDLRFDDTQRLARRSVRRVLGAVTSDRDAETTQTSLYAEAQWAPVDSFKATLGLRWDQFDSEVVNRFNTTASGSGKGDLLSPKFGVAWRPTDSIEIYANRGRGLRSPSQVELSPDNRGARFQDLEPFELKSSDLGVRIDWGNGIRAELAAYRTDTAGEFVQVAPGEFANLGSTTRDGIEGELRWRGQWLEAFFGASRVDAELVTLSAAREVTGVPQNSQVAGITWRPDSYVLDVYAQRYGRAPLNASGSIVRDPVTSISAKLSRQFARFRAFAQLTLNPYDDRSETQFVINGQNAFDPLPSLDAQIGISVPL